MSRIKSELGPQAAILSTDHRKEGNSTICEVVAGLDKPEEDNANGAGEASLNNSQTDLEWRSEWELFKKSVFDLIRPGLDKSELTPRQSLALEHLEKEGVAPELLMQVWQTLRKRNRATLGVLGEFVSTGGLNPEKLPQHRVSGFCGPNGVGKTTSLVRYALECKRRHKDISICLANADGVHAGGRLFLKHYCDLSGFAYEEITSPGLWANLQKLRKRHDLVLVDLPGLTPDYTLQNWLQERGGPLREMDLHLVLSPIYAEINMQSYLNKYIHPIVKSIVWTKVDEACIFGGILNTAWKTGLPISGFGYGTGIRDNSLQITKKDLWQLIFKHKMPPGKNNGKTHE